MKIHNKENFIRFRWPCRSLSIWRSTTFGPPHEFSGSHNLDLKLDVGKKFHRRASTHIPSFITTAHSVSEKMDYLSLSISRWGHIWQLSDPVILSMTLL